MEKIDADSILDHLSESPVDATLSGAIVTSWFKDETEIVKNPEATEVGWMIASGWKLVEKTPYWNPDEGRYVDYYEFKRRVLDTELALQRLVDDYVTAHNNGQTLNDNRYDDIVALYIACLQRTESEVNSLEEDEDSFEDLSLTLINSLAGTWTTHNTAVADLYDDWEDDEADRINLRFNNLLAEKELEMRNTGRYNTTSWDAVEAGIERDREYALNDHNDKKIAREAGWKDRLFVLQRQVDDAIIAARDRVFARIHGEGLARSSLRNQIIDLVCRFAERRTDSYPSMEAIGKIATDLGAGLPSTKAGGS